MCLEHDGFARRKAVTWWKKRSPDPVPESVDRALELAEAGALCKTRAITVRTVTGEKFPAFIDYDLGPLPEPVAFDVDCPPSQIPF